MASVAGINADGLLRSGGAQPRPKRTISAKEVVLYVLSGVVIMFFVFLAIGIAINSNQSPSSPPPSTPNLQQAIKQDQQSVVLITDLITLPNSTRVQFVGSGVIYAANYGQVYVITNRHVVDCIFAGTCPFGSNQTLSLETYNGDTYSLNLENYSGNYLDLAKMVFYDSGSDYKAASVDYNYTPTKGTAVVVIGQPLAAFEAVSQGIISDILSDQTAIGVNFTDYTTDAQINHGNSGGGVFLANDTMQLIGIPTEILTSSEAGGSGLGVITPLNSQTFAASSFYYCFGRGYLYGTTCMSCPIGDMLEQNAIGAVCFNQQNLTDVQVSYISFSFTDSMTAFGSGSSTTLSGFTIPLGAIYRLNVTYTQNTSQEIDKFQSDTPGFTVLNVTPQLPHLMPANSVTNYSIEIRAPNSTYYGPLSIMEYYH